VRLRHRPLCRWQSGSAPPRPIRRVCSDTHRRDLGTERVRPKCARGQVAPLTPPRCRDLL